MKRKLTKVLATVLALSVAISTTDISALAADHTPQPLQTEEISRVEATVSDGDGTEGDGAEDGWDGVTTEAVFEAENYKVTFSLTGYWAGGYNANVRIENTGDTIIENWYLAYDACNQISNIWNAEVYSYENGKYVIKNAGWNQDIPVGGSVQYGFGGNEDFAGFPKGYKLLGESTEAEEEDYTVEYHLDSDWGSGFSGTISITNNTADTIEDWRLAFDFDRTITGIWNGEIESRDGSYYVIKNAGFNSNIAAGQTVSFGFNGSDGAAQDAPYDYRLYSYQTQAADIDMTVDTDRDGLPDYAEDYYGTDKAKEDTDGDGLSDYIELLTCSLDPLLSDTDENGTPDGEEDNDGDGLTNLGELETERIYGMRIRMRMV